MTMLLWISLCFWNLAYDKAFILVNATDVRFGYSTGKWRGGWSNELEPWHGLARLDTYGRIYAHPVKDYWPRNSVSNPCVPLIRTTGEKTLVFKYIAGRVIPGHLENKNGQKTKFVPKVSGKVISIFQYLASDHYYPNHNVPRLENDDHQPPERIVVYNLPAYTMQLKLAMENSFHFKIRALPFPPEANSVENSMKAQRENSVTYRLVSDEEKSRFIARIGSDFYKGNVENGEFFPDFSSKIADDKAKDYPIYRKPLVPNEEVFEYYSGALIAGYLYKIPRGELLLYTKPLTSNPEYVHAADDDYVFVPTTGATIISLQQYLDEYVPGKSKRIHNLPGTIEPITR